MKEVDLKHLFKTPDSRMELAAHVAGIIGYFLVDTKASFTSLPAKSIDDARKTRNIPKRGPSLQNGKTELIFLIRKY